MHSLLKKWKVLDWLLAALVVASALSHGLTPLRSTQDFWWHLKAGQVIVADNYQLPENDIFAFSSEDIAWYNHEWLTQILMYDVYRMGERTHAGAGVQWIIIAKALMLAATFLLLFLLLARRTGSAAVVALVVVVAINVSRYTLYPRPVIVSYFLLAIFLWLIYHYVFGRLKGRWLAVAPLLMALWVNLHGGFILGLIALGAFGAGELALGLWARWLSKYANYHGGAITSICIEGQLPQENSAVHFRHSAVLFGCMAAALAATLLNPYGIHVWEMYWRVMGDSALVGSIPELLPPPWTYGGRLVNVPFYFSIAFVVVGCGVLALWKKKIPHPGELMFVGFFGWQALSHVRHLPLFAITAAPLAAWLLIHLIGGHVAEQQDDAEDSDGGKSEETDSAQQRRRLVRWGAATAALLFALYACCWQDFNRNPPPGETVWEHTFLARNSRLLGGSSADPGRYPEEVCNFILSQQFHGRMFNAINDAGYLIWRLSPRPHKVFTDDRYDIFGGKFIGHEAIIRNAQPKIIENGEEYFGWRELLEYWDFNFAVIGIKWNGQSDGLAEVLAKEDGWELVFYPRPRAYLASGHLIFVRKLPMNQALIDSCRRAIEQRDGGWRWNNDE